MSSLRRYVLRRLALAIPTILGVCTLVFAVLHVVPGDPVDIMLGENAAASDRAALRARMGLDQPLLAQYGAFMSGIARGHLGYSMRSQRPVGEVLAERAPATLRLGLAAAALAAAIGIPLGVLSARRPNGAFDRMALAASLSAVAIPNFWLGPMLVLLFSIQLGWLPVAGAGSPAHLVLPALTLGSGMSGILVRMTRAAMLETMSDDYVRTARAKGLGESRVLVRHALPNALVPILSLVGLQLGAVLAGSVITETIFAWPGLGRLVVEAIQARDYPVVQGAVLAIAGMYVVVNLLTDLAQALVHPRLREAAHGA
ncbi:MAG TPA: ABC transporter permease [Candidatus Limnocylindrales bacterium]|nr:ABC transporter permease [Candidatus Limnocylindrales bacterium]